jgi:hypothetical protein
MSNRISEGILNELGANRERPVVVIEYEGRDKCAMYHVRGNLLGDGLSLSYTDVMLGKPLTPMLEEVQAHVGATVRIVKPTWFYVERGIAYEWPEIHEHVLGLIARLHYGVEPTELEVRDVR